MDKKTLIDWAEEAVKMSPWTPAMFPPSRYYRFLQVLAKQLKPALSVELGVCGGGGSLHLAEGYLGGVVVGVDVAYDHPEQLDYIKRNYPNFTFWQGDSVTDAPLISRQHGLVKILFIDTIHTKSRTIEEFEAWRPFLAPGTVVCFDDLRRKEMDGFWEWLPEPKVRLDLLHPTAESGFGCWFSQ